MAKIHSMMDIGKRAMLNSQTALQTTAHNIANRTTEGYSRQRVEVMTAPPVTEGRLQMGTGNRAASVSRVNNPYLEKQLQKEQGQMGYLDGRAESLGRVEQVFNEQLNKGLNQYMTDFFNSFRELASNPESATTRTMVKEASEALAKDFKRVDTQLTEIQKDLDQNVKSQVEEVNKMTKEIAVLNEKIAGIEISGVTANDERDRRDVLLKRLSEKIDIHHVEGNTGIVTISTAGNALLVSGYDCNELLTYENPDTHRMDVYFKLNDVSPPFRVTDRIKGGSIGGSLTVRDHVITDIRDKIDTIAYELASEVNRAHAEGFDKKNRPGDMFFVLPDQVQGAASQIELNASISEDINRIAAAARPGAIGDNTVANAISSIQHREILDDGTSTIDDFYNAQVGRMGVLAQRAIKSREAQNNILNQLSAIRESVAGVSLDEETTKMLEFQKTFDASARVIRTADEMFDTVLNLKRL